MNRKKLIAYGLIIGFSTLLVVELIILCRVFAYEPEMVDFETLPADIVVEDIEYATVACAMNTEYRMFTLAYERETTLAQKMTTVEETTESEVAEEPMEEAVEEETKIETEEESEVIPLYSCHGKMLDEDLQEYIYSLLSENGIGFYYELFLCQAFQESSYDMVQRTLNHGKYDCGLMQIRESYWDYFCQKYGYSGEILNVYDNVYIAVQILADYWHDDYDVPTMMSHYMTGPSGTYSQQYVDDVYSHLPYLVRVR